MDIDKELKETCKSIRRTIITMLYEAQTCHLGSDLSVVEILATLYFKVLRPQDKFVMSKGHGAAALYATLAEKGIIPKEDLKTYGKEGTKYLNLVSKEVDGVEFSTGALGHGLPAALGMAWAMKYDKSDGRVFVLLSDGEVQCGTFWESLLFASHNELKSLYIIIDDNRLQATGYTRDILRVDNFLKKIFENYLIDGHDTKKLYKYLTIESEMPKILILNTIKGKGVDFAENNNDWHYNNLNEEQFKRAILQNS